MVNYEESDGQTVGWVDGWMMDRCMMDGWMMDGRWMDGQTDTQTGR